MTLVKKPDLDKAINKLALPSNFVDFKRSSVVQKITARKEKSIIIENRMAYKGPVDTEYIQLVWTETYEKSRVDKKRL